MSKIKQYIVYVISPLLLLADFYMLMNNANNIKLLYVPIIGVSMLEIYMELFILPIPKQKKAFWMRWIVIILGTTCLGIGSNDIAYHIFYLVAIFMLVRYEEGKLVWIGMGVIACLLGIIVYIRTDSGYAFLSTWLKEMTIYAAAIGGMLAVKYMITINQNLEKMQVHLLEKNMALTNTYEQLKRAYNELEDYTIMKERTYMSREMHDTVGHTLTTALVELELCKILIKDQDEAKEKLEHASEQVRKGLAELRMTVRKLKQDLDWEQEIYAIGERLMHSTSIKVRTHIDDLKGIENNTLRCIYRIIQESLTNGMKHGKATAFMIDVEVGEEEITIEIIDNGVGAIAFKSGFGLTAMKERVEALKGRIEFESYKDEGFTVRAFLPKINQGEIGHD